MRAALLLMSAIYITLLLVIVAQLGLLLYQRVRVWQRRRANAKIDGTRLKRRVIHRCHVCREDFATQRDWHEHWEEFHA